MMIIMVVLSLQPLARLGAEVTGIDASQENIEVACSHASYDPMAAKQLQYISCPVEKLKMFNTAQYDAVILSEILEHVEDASNFLSECCSLVKVLGIKIQCNNALTTNIT